MRPASRRILAALSAAAAGFLTFALVDGGRAGDTPERIVVAGGDLTEIVFALGAGDQVVGVDQTSVYPAAAEDRAQIGYVRRLSPEGVLSLSPELLIASHDAGPELAIQQLRAAGIAVARAPETARAEDLPAKIAFVGDSIGKAAEAKGLAVRFATDLAAVREKVARLEDRPKVLFILSMQNGATLVGGRETSAHEMIRLAGGENAAKDMVGYKPMGREAIMAAAPDVVLMMMQHADRHGGIDAIIARPELALTPAGQNGRGVAMDGMFLLGLGPRTPQAVAALARALHPEAAADAGF